MATTAEAFQTALAHHQSGNLRQAEVIYRQILADNPQHADALHLLGVIAYQLGRHDLAVEHIRGAITLDGNQPNYHSNLGEAYRALGRLTEAADCYTRALRLDPNLSQAHNNLGNVLKALGRPLEAISAYERAIALQPRSADPLCNLGILLQEQGDLAGAESRFRQALALDARHTLACKNLGTILRRQGRLDEALACCRQAVRLNPQDSEAHRNLGTVFHAQRQLADALASFRETLRLDPRSVPAHVHLGDVLKEAGQLDEAIAAYRAALALQPDLALAHYNIGVILQERDETSAAAVEFLHALRLQPDYVDALINYGFVRQRQGHLDEALDYYTRAVQVNPDFAVSHFHRANVFRLKRMAPEAHVEYLEALRLLPNYPEAYSNLALLYLEQQQLDPAIECCQKGLELAPHSPALYDNMAYALQAQGRAAEAVDLYRKAIELQPNRRASHSQLLNALNYLPDIAPRAVFEEHLEWARRHANPLTPAAPAFPNDRSPDRRLRIGYVSPHFCRHAVNYFSEPMLAAHDHEHFEIFCYSSTPVADVVTARLKASADHWRDVEWESDERVAQMVRDDRIDILVDLTGHIGRNRLLIFARKPAPIQVTYLGYQNTTGMAAMDYRLTDERADPPGVTDEFYTEQLVRLPRSFFCFRPSDAAPPVAPLPALSQGHVTFGAFNNFAKASPAAIAAWLQILRRVPHSRLLVLSGGGGYVERHLHALAQQQGIDAQRIECCAMRPVEEYLKLFQRADVGLDPFPFNGHTTTCDSIWMGVPVVMLAGQTYASRFGGSVLANVGLEHLIAKSIDEYVDLAVDLAADLKGLDELRSELRPRMRSSAIMDFEGFTRHVEQAYRRMWLAWCESGRE